jgi:uncharacterized protein (TIGR03067 family)
LLTKLKIATAVLLVAAILSGVAGLVYQTLAGETQVAQQNKGQPGNTPGPQPKRVAQPASSVTIHGPTKDGLAAFVVATRTKIKLGEDIPIFYGIMNVFTDVPEKTGTRKIWPVHLATGRENRSWFTVKGPDGKDLPSIAPAADWPILTDANVAITLRPGEFHGRVCPNLAGWHKLAGPGVYTITWTHDVHGPKGPWSGRLVSNEIQVELVGGKGNGDEKGQAIEKELVKLNGKWKQTSVETNGQKKTAPADGTPVVVTIKRDRWIVETGKRQTATRFSVDPTENPKAIDIHKYEGGKEFVDKCIYKFDNDTLIICSARMGLQGSSRIERPKEFTTANGGRTIFEFRRLEK